MRRRPEAPHECGKAAIALAIDAEGRTPRSNANSSSGPHPLPLTDVIYSEQSGPQECAVEGVVGHVNVAHAGFEVRQSHRNEPLGAL